VSAVLSGLLLNVALYAVVRCKVLVAGTVHTSLAGNLMMGFGISTMTLAAFLLWRQKDIKRLFAYSSVEHMGIATFAFGMGGPVANFAALLHMTVHSLTKSSLFFTAGEAAQKAGTQIMEKIRSLLTSSPSTGWALMLGTLTILGMPPFGVFTSEFLILITAVRDHPWSIPFLVLSLGVAFGAIFFRVQGMVFGESTQSQLSSRSSLVPTFIHLGVVLMLGLYIPLHLAQWYETAARLLG